jgi:hypothetical protein
MQNKNGQEEMFFVIEEWRQSGLTQKEYCRQHNLVYHQFHYWYRKYREQQPAPELSSAFVQIKPAITTSTPFAELFFPGGGRVVFHQPVSIEYLKGLAG